jgi:dUTP pyrophosphatase
VHVTDDGLHAGQHVRGLVDHQVGALGHDLEVVVGDDGGDLDDGVAGGVEPGHLEVHPHQHLRIVGSRSVLPVPIVRLDRDLPVPSYARVGDAGADLIAREDALLAAAGGRALVPTGIAIAIPEGFAGLVQPRSGLALRHGVTCLNTPGLIDAGYRDEVRVLLVNTDPTEPYEVKRGDRIAQLVIQAVEQADFVEVDELPASERGTGGFGHSGR